MKRQFVSLAILLCLQAFLYPVELMAAEQVPANPDKKDAIASNQQLTLSDLKIFETDDPAVPKEKRDEIAARIKEETGLEKPRSMPVHKKSKLLKAFNNGRASEYTVQELLDAGVFQFKPILNFHPNSVAQVDDKSVRPRDGKDLEIDNETWGKKSLPAVLRFGVMHSTEDAATNAAWVVDSWNHDSTAGKRSSSAPFIVGRCTDVKSPEIVVSADFESRWQRHCSSKLTNRPELVNWTSVGVEMVHSTERKVDYTDEEIKNAARLWTYIQQRAKFADNCLITHGEIQGHLPKDHISFRTDPEGFPWDKFADEMVKLRKKSKFQPPASDETLPPTKPQAAISESLAK